MLPLGEAQGKNCLSGAPDPPPHTQRLEAIHRYSQPFTAAIGVGGRAVPACDIVNHIQNLGGLARGRPRDAGDTGRTAAPVHKK